MVELQSNGSAIVVVTTS